MRLASGVTPADGGKRPALPTIQFARGFANQEAKLPMPRVESKSDRPAIFGAEPSLSTENEELPTRQQIRIPTHPRILTQPKNVAARRVHEHFRS